MKIFVLLTVLLSTAAFAKCPSYEHSRVNGWRLYEEDQERELWNCKMTKSDSFKRLEFCVGRLTSSMVSEYIGLAGIEEWKRDYYPQGVIGMTSMWIQLDGDKEGEATDTRDLLTIDYKPTTDIMNNYSRRFLVTLNKKTGRATFESQKKKYPCILCGGWKTDTTSELKCTIEK